MINKYTFWKTAAFLFICAITNLATAASQDNTKKIKAGDAVAGEAKSASCARPEGKGIPMQKASGAITRMLTRMRTASGVVVSNCSNGPSANR